ncbi:PAS sensor protein [uncultured Duncaniella sp.]|uniref:PAS sensor protein n=1 Tax=uncultured Duncaniella sp. TaxID=2768039 RepID=UPI00265A43DC|nr:PAS sensor protein [uncultured Duncaniella sp.]
MDMIQEFQWAEYMNCAVTVCDKEGVILYMNAPARELYRKHGDLIGTNLLGCHSERSRGIIRHMLDTGESNSYTIRKQGLRKMIYQTPWRKDGEVAGIVEISMIIPEELPHYDRG